MRSCEEMQDKPSRLLSAGLDNSGGDNQTRDEAIQKIMIDPDLPLPKRSLRR
jgi:hypothetical protein